MPNYLQLHRKTTGEPVAFQAIDEELCAHFKAQVNRVRWYLDWYAILGIRLATGATFETLMAECPAIPDSEETRFLACLQWLDEHFTVSAFYRRT